MTDQAKKSEEILVEIEKKNLDKFVNNYLKMDLDPVKAYQNTFEKHLWRTQGNAKKRALDLIKDIEFIELKNDKLDDLREVFKEEITLAFGHLSKTLKDEFYTSYKHYFDPKTKRVKEYSVKENISHSSKNKAAELILKTMGYLDKQEQNVAIIHNEYEVVKDIINAVEEEFGK